MPDVIVILNEDAWGHGKLNIQVVLEVIRVPSIWSEAETCLTYKMISCLAEESILGIFFKVRCNSVVRSCPLKTQFEIQLSLHASLFYFLRCLYCMNDELKLEINYCFWS